MAEQRFCKPQVGGSIPLASSIPTFSNSNEFRFVLHQLRFRCFAQCARKCARTRLFLSFKVLREGPSRSFQVCLVDDVLAVEYRAGLMATDRHGNLLWNACP